MFSSAFFELAAPRVRQPHTIFDTYIDLIRKYNSEKKHTYTKEEFDAVCAKTICHFIDTFKQQSNETKKTIIADLIRRADHLDDEQLRLCFDFIKYVDGQGDTGFPIRVAAVLTNYYCKRIFSIYSDLFLEKNGGRTKYTVRVAFSTTDEFDNLCAKTIRDFVDLFQKQSKDEQKYLTAELIERAKRLDNDQLRFCIDFVDYSSTDIVKGEEIDNGFPMKVVEVIAERYNAMMHPEPVPEPVPKPVEQPRRAQRQAAKAGNIERQSSMMLRK